MPLSCDWPVPDQFDMDLTNQPMVNSRYVLAVADPIDALFDQTHTHHSFTVVIELGCNSLVAAKN
jgi:hypothetical protein